MLRSGFLCLFLGLTPLAHAQQKLAGHVVDGVTGKPVPYASLSVLGTTAGTTSNAEGGFELTVATVPSRVLVSDVRYVRDTVTITAASPTLQLALQPATVMLPEVQLNSYAPDLIRRAYRRLRHDNPQKRYGRSFYRQITSLAGEATEVQEMIWEVKTSNAGVEGTALAQARYAEKKALVNFKNFSTLTKAITLFSSQADSMASTSVISPNVDRNYTLRLLGVTQNGGQQLVEIGFASKPGNPRQSTGSVLIDENSYQVLRFRAETPDTRLKASNPTFALKDGWTTFELGFQSAPDGAALDYIKVSYRGALNRPFQAPMAVQSSSFAYFYDGQPTPGRIAYQSAKAGESDLAAVKQTTYDAAFWQSSSIVKRTPLEEEVIRAFEQQKAFGNLLTH